MGMAENSKVPTSTELLWVEMTVSKLVLSVLSSMRDRNLLFWSFWVPAPGPVCTPKYLLTDMWSVYTVVYHSATKRNQTGPFVGMWMDLETATQSEVRKTNIVYRHIYVESRAWQR